MATKQPLSAKITNAKKRKSGDNLPQKPTKQPRKTLDSYFTPQVPISAGKDQKTRVAKLSDEQKEVLRMVVDEGKNVFFTGSAGTGKSLLLRAIISALRKKHANKPDVVAVTASTGMAASNIGGMTIHSWGAVAPGNHNIEALISYIKVCKPALRRWKNTKVLVIDEVSMVDGLFFDTLAALADRLRKKTDIPFGGIQLIVTGDFFQLPPVSKGEAFFAFESASWKTCMEHTVNLTKVFRQKDNHFISILNEMRQGTISPTAISTFKSLSRSLPPPPPSAPNILPTELFPLRNEVSNANSARLRALPDKLHVFDSHDTFPAFAPSSSSSKVNTKQGSSSNVNNKQEGLLGGVLAEKRLELKKGAQVMLVKNVDEILVNGCVGKVVGFWNYRDVCAAKDEGQKNGTGGPPKTTGVVRDVKVGLDGELVRNQKTLVDEDNKENVAGKVAPKAKPSANITEEDKFPVVEFPTPDGGKEAVLLMRDEFRVEDSDGKLLARRMQVPLILAWAMSIHKSQGQTIQRVKVDLGKVFEKGQSYVALSRAASMDGLQVLRFDQKKVMAHPKVIQWSKSLLEVNKNDEGCS